MRTKPQILGVAVLLFFALQGSGALAQDDALAERSGWTVGGSIGGGLSALNCNDCTYKGVALEVHVGQMLSPYLTLLIEGFTFVTFLGEKELSREEVDRVHLAGTIGLRYWLLQRLWIGGAVGPAHRFTTADVVSRSDWGASAKTDTGVELLQYPSFAVDARLRIGGEVYSGTRIYTATVAVGVSWF